MSLVVRWSVVWLLTALSFSLAAWISGVYVLPSLTRSAADKWAMAAVLWAAVAALAAERTIAAGRDIAGIASTGDGTTSVQRP
jgi:hypothetical protein